jgi:hypothetical protein
MKYYNENVPAIKNPNDFVDEKRGWEVNDT